MASRLTALNKQIAALTLRLSALRASRRKIIKTMDQERRYAESEALGICARHGCKLRRKKGKSLCAKHLRENAERAAKQ